MQDVSIRGSVLQQVGAAMPRNAKWTCASRTEAHGFSLHAGVRCRMHQREGSGTPVPLHHLPGERRLSFSRPDPRGYNGATTGLTIALARSAQRASE
jgi:hypothetical protein